MKKGFTLIEMLIVVAVLVTLMTITFRLSSIGSDQTARNATIARLQRVENCLSGYFAAFGSYPPVKLHGSRNIYLEVGTHGLQNEDVEENIWGWDKIGDDAEQRAWRQVKAACKAQPFDMQFPFPENWQNYIKKLSARFAERANSGDERYKSYWSDPAVKDMYSAGFGALASGESAVGRLLNRDDTEWRDIQIFKFGVMSYILPRYLVMMNGDDEFFKSTCRQWNSNNALPCDAMNGSRFSSWAQIKQYLSDTKQQNNLARVANIPSQAVCARWMPNLAGICSCWHGYKDVTFGIEIKSSDDDDDPVFEIFSPGDDGSTSDQYVLDSVTIRDGWHNEFYYYSPPPYQSYTVWSGGANGRTFPPWIDRANMTENKANEKIGLWISDDIIHMSN